MPNLPRVRGSVRSENSSGEQSGVASRAITPWTRDGPPIAAHNMLWVLLLWLLWARAHNSHNTHNMLWAAMYAQRAITPYTTITVSGDKREIPK